MAYQTVFKRYELKYMLTREQKNRILKAMAPYMELDRFGRSTIRNVYYDTLHPVVFLSYEREAYYAKDESDFRVTLDDTILCRQEDISLESEVYGTPILPENVVLMEVKCSGGIPIWMTNVLFGEHIYKTSFSKYGTAYKRIIFPKLKEGTYHD
ncbi:MAG: VTC domain-containing protein [Lachnospiraceae bacterium]|nr:VTC domain-containing protein [Lachnospiraceae bacterium]